MSVSINGTNGIVFNDGSIQKTSAFTGFRNRIINGDMRIDQRNAGSAVTLTTGSPSYTLDRWYAYQNSPSTGVQISRSTSAPSGFQNSIKWGRNGSGTAGGVTALGQVLETANSLDLQGSYVTLSFYARAGANFSSSSSQLAVSVISGTGTDQSALSMVTVAWTNSAQVISTGVTLTTSWQKFTLTSSILGSSVSQLGVDFRWTTVGAAGADDNVYITGVQLEAGSTATDFERRPIGTELALCQRYFNRYGGVTSASGYAGIASGVVASSAQAEIVSFLPVAMRSSPTISFSGSLSVYDGTVRTLTSIVSTYDSSQKTAVYFAVGASGGGLTAGRGAILWANNSSSNYLDFNSEL